jgi:hypothetical protein
MFGQVRAREQKTFCEDLAKISQQAQEESARSTPLVNAPALVVLNPVVGFYVVIEGKHGSLAVALFHVGRLGPWTVDWKGVKNHLLPVRRTRRSIDEPFRLASHRG